MYSDDRAHSHGHLFGEVVVIEEIYNVTIEPPGVGRVTGAKDSH